MKRMTFIQAMKDYFGLLPDTTNTHFMQEVRKLSAEDRAFFERELPKVGYEIVKV